jgi:von Willebrand factor type A domain/Bacterial extracellular solute-binding protein
MRKLSDGAANTVDDLFRKLPQAPDPAAISSSVAALPATEQSVWRYNTGRPAVPLAAVYPTEGALRLDYPYLVTQAGTDATRARAGEQFLAELQRDQARADLLSAGFRAPDGSAGSALSSELGVDPRVPKGTARPPARAVAAALKSWDTLSLATRILVLVDVSGTMNQLVPAAGKSRIQVTVAAAAQGLGMFSDATEMGLWEFSAQLRGTQDWRELVPTGPMAQPVGDVPRRGALAKALTQIVARPQNTGLYDSILAAYRSQRAGYKPGKVNSVLVFTDGKNNDPAGGISLDGLLAQLKQLGNPAQPIPVFIVAFGKPADVDMPTMRRITDATKGAAYNVNTPADISKVFLDAVGRRTCQPNC